MKMDKVFRFESTVQGLEGIGFNANNNISGPFISQLRGREESRVMTRMFLEPSSTCSPYKPCNWTVSPVLSASLSVHLTSLPSVAADPFSPVTDNDPDVVDF